MPGINPLWASTLAPCLLSSLLPSTRSKIQNFCLLLQYTIPSEGNCLAAMPDPEQVGSATLWGNLLKECYATGKPAWSFCQMASGERSSLSRLSSDTLPIHKPFLRLCLCAPFLVPLSLCCEVIHTYLSFCCLI